jgi:hypothetical protein
MKRGVILILSLFALLAPGCSGAVDGSAGTTSSDATSGAASGGADRTVAVGPGAESTVEVLSGEDTAGETTVPPSARFTEKPEASGGSRYEADTILAVRYGRHEGYERVVVDLGVGDDHAGKVPEWNLIRQPGDGVLRVTFPSVSATGISDGPLGGGLLDRFYVVRAPERGMFMDISARRAFAYRVIQLRDPARLVVDFEPAERSSKVIPPAAGGGTVLLEPHRRARIDGPLTVSGYSRNFEASNTIILEDGRGKTVARQSVQANDWASTWGYFETTLHAPTFHGVGTLRVGVRSARDGTFEGVELPVRGR